MKKNNIKILLLLLTIVCLFGCFTACESTSKCNHIEGSWIVDKEATLDFTGKRHTECTLCGEIVQSETIPQKTCAHIDTKWVVDSEATLDAEGSRHLECKSCGKNIKSEVIPKIYLTQADITSKLRSSVVKVICYDYDGKTEISQGSGFFIDNMGTFITNAHVVKDCFFIKVQTYLGITYDVDIMYEYNGTTSDYAICNAKNCYFSDAVEFASSAKIGDTVYALGYPNDAFILKTTSGKITSTDAVDGTKHYYANTAWIDHGSSGGILADAQGRVLGITTGKFADSEYAALKYQDFKFDAEGIHVGTKEPLEYFHTVDEVSLYSFNIDDYFDIVVNGTVISNTSVSYTVTLQLKEKYRTAKFVLDSTSISVNVNFDTIFKYKEVTSYGGTRNKTQTDTEYLRFTFWDEDDLILGDSQYFTSSIYISFLTEYYDMNISYEVDSFSGFGTFIIYDKNK